MNYILLIPILVGLSCPLPAEPIPQWEFYCLNHDVAIIDGILHEPVEDGTEKIKKREVHRDLFASPSPLSGSFLIRRNLEISRKYYSNNLLDSITADGGGFIHVSKGIMKSETVVSEKFKDGPGIYLVIWCPVPIDPVFIVVAKLDKADLPRALRAREKWLKAKHLALNEALDGIRENQAPENSSGSSSR